MPSATIIPCVDSGKLALIQHIDDMFSAYTPALNFSAAHVAELGRATAWFKYRLDPTQSVAVELSTT
jgi:hypothetical protein